jgi:hypothetical protein
MRAIRVVGFRLTAAVCPLELDTIHEQTNFDPHCTLIPELLLKALTARQLMLITFLGGPGSSVSIATGYRLDGQGIESW